MRATPSGLAAAIRVHVRPTGDGHRVTSLELFFDLVFVYAITNVSGLVEHHPGGRSAAEAVLILVLVWWAWCSYAWLGNQAKADEGLLRLTLLGAMGAMFFMAISIPFAFTEDSNAAIVIVVAFGILRLLHNFVYLVAAGDDTAMRATIRATIGLVLVVLVPLSIGAAVEPHERMWWWLAAVVIDVVGVFFIRSTGWSLSSASHFAERFGLIVLIAIGESVVGLGVATSAEHLSWSTAAALLCGLAIAACLWWTYFDVVALVAERTLSRAQGLPRTRLARDSFTYLHLPIVGGIVFTAVGIALTVHDHEHALAGRIALFGGIAVDLLAMAALRWRNVGSINVQRAVLAVVLIVLIPVLAHVPALVQLAVPAALLIALVSFEVTHLREARATVRQGGTPPVEESSA